MNAVLFNEQGSDAWHAERAGVTVTASMAGAVLGLNPHTNRNAAMREKVREMLGAEREFTGNAATAHGQKSEPIARDAYEDLTGELVLLDGFSRHPDYDFIGASPDGLVGDRGLVEIKCPYAFKGKAKTYSIDDKPYYFAQIQIQLEVLDRAWCDFVCWTADGMTVERVLRDPDWFEKNLPALIKFNEEVREIVADDEKAAPFLAPAEIERDDEIFVNIEKQYVDLSAEISKLQAKQKELKDQLIEEAAGTKTRGQHILIYPTTKQGSISYAKAIKELLPDADLEKYRGKPSTSWSIREHA